MLASTKLFFSIALTEIPTELAKYPRALSVLDPASVRKLRKALRRALACIAAIKKKLRWAGAQYLPTARAKAFYHLPRVDKKLFECPRRAQLAFECISQLKTKYR